MVTLVRMTLLYARLLPLQHVAAEGINSSVLMCDAGCPMCSQFNNMEHTIDKLLQAVDQLTKRVSYSTVSHLLLARILTTDYIT